jgi:hypothetical protein
MREIVNSVVAVVACRFIQDRHTDRYLEPKRETISVGNSPTCPTCPIPKGHVVFGQESGDVGRGASLKAQTLTLSTDKSPIVSLLRIITL